MSIESWGTGKKDGQKVSPAAIAYPQIGSRKQPILTGEKFYWSSSGLIPPGTWNLSVVTIPVGYRLEIKFFSIGCDVSIIQRVKLRGIGSFTYAFFDSVFDKNAWWDFPYEMIFPLEANWNFEVQIINNDVANRNFYVTLYGVYTEV